MEALSSLKEFLDANKIENRIDEIPSYDGERIIKYLTFNFPVAREHEEIRISEDNRNIENILKSNFVKYRGISDYEAIWSSELGCIECEIDAPRYNMPGRYVLKRLSKYFNVNVDEYIDADDSYENDEPLSLVLYSSDRAKVSIGYSSKEFFILSTQKDGRHFDLDKDRRRFRLTIKIENITIKTQDEAKKALEKISNALFYQLDILYDFLITLSPRRETRIERMRKSRRFNSTEDIEPKELELKYEYDEIPMALYWLAQSSSYSPIFRYFALYQVIEYYYPIYATINTKIKIQNLIKDPKFNINKDADVLRLLTIIKTNNVGNIGDEREQLNITLRNIISGDDIIEFISGNQNLQDYYTGKSWKRLCEQKLRLTDSLGIIDDVAARIYEIRCRIVHNKASEISNKILPMTKEVDFLVNEVNLLEFIARKAIIANSRPFNFG